MELQKKWGKSALIVIALAMAGGSFWLSKSYLSKQEAIITSQLTSQYLSKAQIIVASQDLESGQFMSADVLAIADVPDQFLPVDVILPDQFEEIKGLEIQLSIPKGKPILLSYLGDHIARKFSDTIPVGFRAITIEVDTINSHENMMEVGDKVDLFVQNEAVMNLLMERVTVLATGNLRSASQDPDGILIGDNSNYTNYQSITLLLPLASIASVRHAEQSNGLVVLLRNAQDIESIQENVAVISANESVVQYMSNKKPNTTISIIGTTSLSLPGSN